MSDSANTYDERGNYIGAPANSVDLNNILAQYRAFQAANPISASNSERINTPTGFFTKRPGTNGSIMRDWLWTPAVDLSTAPIEVQRAFRYDPNGGPTNQPDNFTVGGVNLGHSPTDYLYLAGVNDNPVNWGNVMTALGPTLALVGGAAGSAIGGAAGEGGGAAASGAGAASGGSAGAATGAGTGALAGSAPAFSATAPELASVVGTGAASGMGSGALAGAGAAAGGGGVGAGTAGTAATTTTGGTGAATTGAGAGTGAAGAGGGMATTAGGGILGTGITWGNVLTAGAGIGSAIMGSNASQDAANSAANATKSAAETAANSQEKMYNQTRSDFAPFLAGADQTMATLRAGAYGTPQTYKDASGATQTATYAPTESAGFKYTKSRTLEDLGRQLRMIGRGTGTVAANSMGRTLGELNANNDVTYKNDLLNLAKIGQGAAGSTSAAGQNTANNLSNTAISTGNNLANLAIQNGQTQANLYGGIGGTLANMYGNYQLGQYLNNRG